MKRFHENDDYLVAVYPTDDTRGIDWVECYSTCSFVKAVLRYISFNLKYKKHSIKFVHCRYN